MAWARSGERELVGWSGRVRGLLVERVGRSLGAGPDRLCQSVGRSVSHPVGRAGRPAAGRVAGSAHQGCTGLCFVFRTLDDVSYRCTNRRAGWDTTQYTWILVGTQS
jgi:hypothetical protein